MKEDLLTSEEINQIIEEANNPKYIDPFLMHLGRKKTSIFKVSPNSGLILVNGNEWTGREHIDNRHGLSSRIPYWNEDDKIGNPTKFSLNIVPIHYIDLADRIYHPDKLNNSKNKRSDLFDVYIATTAFNKLPELEYTLILYKGTKIIHSLFLSSNKKPYNKKKILNLRQGWSGCSYEIMSGKEVYNIPYFDKNSTERVKVILISMKPIQKDRWYVQVNDISGVPKFTRFIKEEDGESFDLPPIRSTKIDFSNLSWIEKEIKSLINDLDN